MEERFNMRMQACAGNQMSKFACMTQFFDDVILKDQHFSSMLQKIKNAYADYIENIQAGNQKVKKAQISDLDEERRKNAQLAEKVASLNLELQQKEATISDMHADITNLKSQMMHQSNCYSGTASPATGLGLSKKKMTFQSLGMGSDDLLNLSKSSADHFALQTQVTQLQDQVRFLEDELHYRKLREKKFGYLITILQQRGYPVTQVFQEEIAQV